MTTRQPEALIPDEKTVMAQAQVYASTWAIVGSRFDAGDGLELAEQEKTILADMVRRLGARITALESQLAQRFDAADMATASAQGFRDGVAAPQPAVAAGWQSIETAPKDGSYLLLWEQYSDAPFVGYWSGGSWSVSHEHVDAEGGWDGANVVDALSMPITHWMPLPPAPGPADGESNG